MFKRTPCLSDITVAILAGGLGSRLRDIIPGRQKVAAKILGRPFLTFLLDQLVLAGAKKIVLCTGYQSNDVRERIGDRYHSLNIIYSEEEEPLGTGGALRKALPFLESGHVMAMNGDSFINADLTAYLNWFFEKKRPASLLLTKAADTKRYGTVSINSMGIVTDFNEKGSSTGPGWINAGVYFMQRSLLETIPFGISYSLEFDFFPGLPLGSLFGYCVENDFIDIGTPDSFRKAGKFFKRIS